MATSVLVTGGTGFLGVFIVDALRTKHPDWDLTIFDLNPPKKSKPNITYLQGDVTIAEDAESVVEKVKPRAIIHSAGIVPPLKDRFSRELEASVLNINVNGTRNMLAAAQSNNVPAFIYTSSCTAVTDDFQRSYRNIDEAHPTSPFHSLIYGESKARAEHLVLAANNNKTTPGFSTCALRPSVLCGPGDYQLIPSIHACIAKGETPFILGTGTNLWDVTYAPNVADAHVLAVENLLSSEKTAAGEALFIQNNEPIAFRDFCLEVWKNFGHVPAYEVGVPMRVAWLAGWVAEWVTLATGTVSTLSRGSVMGTYAGLEPFSVSFADVVKFGSIICCVPSYRD